MKVFVYYLYFIPLLTSVIFSRKAFRLNWPFRFKLFSWLLAAVLGVELFANLWKYFIFYAHPHGYSVNNVWVYNLFLLPQYTLYTIYFYSLITNKLLRSVTIIFGIILFLFSVYNLLLLQGVYQINSYSIAGWSLLVVISSISYYVEFINRAKQFDIFREPSFWIVTGAFLFHIACVPFFLFSNQLNRTNPALSFTLFQIIVFLNFLMYTFYTIAFLCRNKYTN